MPDRSVAIVTGASSGIGQATALALARRGCAVVLAARRVDRLQDVARGCQALGGQAEVMPVDVAREEQVDSLVAAAVERFGRVDVMVNNAGFGLVARVHETSAEQMRAIFDVNFFGVFHGCKAVAPVMIRQRSGHIFNVSSVIGKRGSPFHGAYCATKFAICGLTDSMRVELAGYNVRVTCVCPGTTATEFFHRSERVRKAGRSFAKFQPVMTPAAVGRKIAATVGKPTPEIVFGLGGKFLVLAAAVWPRLADAMMKLYHDDLVGSLKPGS
jgi:short-subunit dehydrogenase